METGIPIPERTTEGIVEWLNREIVRRSGAKLRRRGAGGARGEEASRGDGAGERHRRRGRARGDGVGGIVPCLLVREYDGNGNSDNESGMGIVMMKKKITKRTIKYSPQFTNKHTRQEFQ